VQPERSCVGCRQSAPKGGLAGEVMTIVLADAALPNLRSAGLLPGGDLAAELGMLAVKYWAPWSHCQSMSPSLLRRCSYGRKGPDFCRIHGRSGPLRPRPGRRQAQIGLRQ
jgi:hypothetical protein